jgi:hypothetical protein
MTVVLLTTVSYNCAPVMAQPEQLFAQGDISDGNQSVTPEEMEQCMDAWDSSTQMSHREWAQSCRRTLRLQRHEKADKRRTDANAFGTSTAETHIA